MSTVEEIESAIANLKEDEFLRLAKWPGAKVADTLDRLLFEEAGRERAPGELSP